MLAFLLQPLQAGLALSAVLGLGTLGPSVTSPAPFADTPNILVIVLDDLGTDKLRMYNDPLHPSYPTLAITPQLDALRATGIMFTNCHGNPTCSPTRAELLSGHYSFRTGMLNYLIGTTGNTAFTLAPPPGELLLPYRLRNGPFTGGNPNYHCGAFGKWHLAIDLPANYMHPINNGFEKFTGHMSNNDLSHFDWTRIDANALGATASPHTTTWDARDARLAAEQWILNEVAQSHRFFAYVAFNPPHAAVQIPQLDFPGGGAPPTNISTAVWNDPDFQAVYTNAGGLYPNGIVTPLSTCGPASPDIVRGRVVYRANVEAVDWEIKQLILNLGTTVMKSTMVFVVSDNGTPDAVIEDSGPAPSVAAGPPYAPGHGKKHNYELGTRLALVAQGPLARTSGTQTVCDKLVDVVDIWSTIADIGTCQLPTGATWDGFSFRNLLAQPVLGVGARTFSYSEAASHNGLTYDPTLAPNTGWWSLLTNAEVRLPGIFTYIRSVVYVDPVAPNHRFKLIRNRRCAEIACTGAGCQPDLSQLPGVDYCQGDGSVEELYDLTADPNELSNLICSMSGSTVLSTMRAQMRSLTGD